MQAFHLFTADVRGDRRNTVYPRAVEINTLAQLQQAAQYDHVGAAFKDNRRQNEGFLWADCLIADVDNAAGDVVEPAQIADDLPDVQHYILFSRHHLLAKGTAPAVPRFHVLFPIDRTEDREQLEGLKRALCSRFPYYDAACVDGARFFFGTECPQGGAVDGLFTLDEVLDPETEAPPEEHAAASVEVIPQGSRNDTLSAYALKVLKAKGADDGTARQLFDAKAAQCVPPLDDDELETIWRAAVRAYRAKVANKPDYLDPTAYALQGLQEGSTDAAGLRPSDYSNLAQARIFERRNAGEVLYSAGLGWLVWDGSKFAADESAANRRFHALTDAQIVQAREEVKAAAAAGIEDSSNAKAKQDAAKRLVLAAELEEGTRLDVSMLKRLCSTDAVHAEPKYKQPFEFIPSHTCVLFTNFLPKVGSSDAGTWSRLVVVPCRAKFRNEAGEIKDMAGHLFDHAGGAVLSWIIEGARRFIAADFKLDPPPCVREAVEEYKADNDWLAHFLEDCCEIGKDYSEKSGVVLATYREWSTRMGEFPRRQDEFKAALEGVGIRWKKTKQGNFYRGLKLLPEWF